MYQKKQRKTTYIFSEIYVVFNMSNCLSLDLGTKTGFCVFKFEDDGIKVSKSGTRNFSQPSKAHLGRRFVCFRDWLIRIIAECNIGAVYYEQVYGHTGIQASHVYGGFLYHMAAVCDDMGVPIYGIGVCTIKKIATGNGHASKEEVIQAVRKRGFNPIDDNEADSIAIAVTVNQVKSKT